MTSSSSADIAAVGELADRVRTLAYQYLHSLPNDPLDIISMQIEAEKIIKITQNLRSSIQTPAEDTLKTSTRLAESLRACTTQLKELEAGLGQEVHSWGFTRMIKHMGLTEIWPYGKENFEKHILAIKRCGHAIAAAPHSDGM